MWKKNKNVRITYTAVSGTSPAHIDDVVTYQALGSTKVKTVHGVDKPFSVLEGTGAKEGGGGEGGGDGEDSEGKASLGYNWRGKGWLAIASSKWEVLGWGDEDNVEGGNQWVVTYFAKTLFTPAGVDLYSRKGQLKDDTIAGIREGLKGLGGDVANLAGELFIVASDGDRTD